MLAYLEVVLGSLRVDVIFLISVQMESSSVSLMDLMERSYSALDHLSVFEFFVAVDSYVVRSLGTGVL